MTYETQFHPEWVAEDVFLAENATVLGRVKIGKRSSVWFGAVLRGDTAEIRLGEETNIQDLCVLHADAGQPCELGDRVSVGHAAIVHGATVEDEVLIGMRAVILNGAHIGRGSLIAAGAIVPEGTSIPPESVVMGVPGKIVRQCRPHDLERIRYAAAHYVEAAEVFRQSQQDRPTPPPSTR